LIKGFTKLSARLSKTTASFSRMRGKTNALQCAHGLLHGMRTRSQSE